MSTNTRMAISHLVDAVAVVLGLAFLFVWLAIYATRGMA